LRLQTLRSAIFWPVSITPGGLLRIASGTLNGTQLLCILHSFGSADQPADSRRWGETEYCVDTASGLLRVYSQAPGMYVMFDYEQALQFHGRTLPRQISIYEAGKEVVKARMASIEDLGAVDEQVLGPTQEMLARGPVAPAGSPMRFGKPTPAPGNMAMSAIQPVIVHASIGPDGHVLEAEALQNYPALSELAVKIVREGAYPNATMRGSRQREAFINVRFGAIQETAKNAGPKAR
jgi:hypothetical protein